MKYFRYSMEDDEIKAPMGEIEAIPPHFIEMKNSLGSEKIHYKIENGKFTEIIGEANTEEAAKRRVEEFIAGLNVNLNSFE